MPLFRRKEFLTQLIDLATHHNAFLYVVSESLLASRRIPALTGANGNGNGHSNGHSNGNGNGNGSRKGNGHGPVKGSDLTPWGRAGDAPEGWS